jgi:hypothetical protein
MSITRFAREKRGSHNRASDRLRERFIADAGELPLAS